MLFKTIKNTTTTLTVITICLVCTAVLIFSMQEHENLYLESVKNDLDSLSANMASDLVPLLAISPDTFEISTLLLRLERYNNVKFAVVFNKKWQQQDVYIGGAFDASSSDIDSQLNQLNQLKRLEKRPWGVQVDNDELIALKLIGDVRLPLGYLLIVNDSLEPLTKSKHSLLKQVLPLTLLAVLIVIVISFFIQHQLFLPLSRLSALAHKIQKTNDYSLRIDVRGKQEVAELGGDINRMMETIYVETQKNKEQTQRLIEQQKAMERLANFDGLTGLPNRQFFMEHLRVELAKATRDKKNLVLMYFDLDGFKGVNDTLGHETGDQLLIKVCERAKTLLREGDVISRLGGDEFLILLHNEPNDIMLFEIAERLVKGLSVPFEINTWEVQIGVSVGIAKASDSHFNLSEFVSNADIAMYRSKTAGRSTHTIFIPEMMEDNKRKLLIANSIATAIKNDEFILHYQAKVAPDETIVGYEALLRWHSESLGIVLPSEFIPIAEQSGKILPITMWVLNRVCQDLSTLQQLNKTDTVISVNLSAHDIKSKVLIDFIKNLIVKYSVKPNLLEFEVTESAYLENLDMANDFLTQLRDMGSLVALDDFGTGYSSLGYLTQINIDTLKIDKQFVDNLNVSDRSTLITKTIIEMAKQLNLRICAEGVETREQAQFLIESGCHQLQGYLFSKPKSLETLLKDNVWLVGLEKNS
jgi:diguanylate cyclase (GGDEF)-like protein